MTLSEPRLIHSYTDDTVHVFIQHYFINFKLNFKYAASVFVYSLSCQHRFMVLCLICTLTRIRLHYGDIYIYTAEKYALLPCFNNKQNKNYLIVNVICYNTQQNITNILCQVNN